MACRRDIDDIGDDHRRAAGDESLGDGAANTGCSASDEGALACPMKTSRSSLVISQ